MRNFSNALGQGLQYWCKDLKEGMPTPNEKFSFSVQGLLQGLWNPGLYQIQSDGSCMG